MDMILGWALVVSLSVAWLFMAFARRPPVIDPQSHDGGDRFKRQTALITIKAASRWPLRVSLYLFAC
jgi:hypothetical protein